MLVSCVRQMFVVPQPDTIAAIDKSMCQQQNVDCSSEVDIVFQSKSDETFSYHMVANTKI